MYNEEYVLELVTLRFEQVPYISEIPEHLGLWVSDAIAQHIPTGTETKDIHLTSLLATSIGCRSIALNLAHYFKFNDINEQIDKTVVHKQYLALADKYYQDYLEGCRLATVEKNSSLSTNFRQPRRPDR